MRGWVQMVNWCGLKSTFSLLVISLESILCHRRMQVVLFPLSLLFSLARLSVQSNGEFKPGLVKACVTHGNLESLCIHTHTHTAFILPLVCGDGHNQSFSLFLSLSMCVLLHPLNCLYHTTPTKYTEIHSQSNTSGQRARDRCCPRSSVHLIAGYLMLQLTAATDTCPRSGVGYCGLNVGIQ